jgi:ureidoglycolate lyase
MDLKEISDKSFAKYGKLFAKSLGMADMPDSFDENSSYWHNIQKEHMKSESLTVGYLSVKKQPAKPDVMERHVRFGEIFVTISGGGVLPVCAAADAPYEKNIEFYRVKPGDAFLLHDGVWHTPPVAHGCDEIDFIMIVPHDILSDIDKKNVATVR